MASVTNNANSLSDQTCHAKNNILSLMDIIVNGFKAVGDILSRALGIVAKGRPVVDTSEHGVHIIPGLS